MENSDLPMETLKSARMAAVCSSVRLGSPILGTIAELKLQVIGPNVGFPPPPTSAPQTESAASPRAQEPSARRSLPIELDQRRGAAVVSL